MRVLRSWVLDDLAQARSVPGSGDEFEVCLTLSNLPLWWAVFLALLLSVNVFLITGCCLPVSAPVGGTPLEFFTGSSARVVFAFLPHGPPSVRLHVPARMGKVTDSLPPSGLSPGGITLYRSGVRRDDRSD